MPEPRVLLFTDTLGDVNGVSRFLQQCAACALASGKPLTIFTSTRFAVPELANIRNFVPRFACALPGYANLELALPPVLAMLAASRELCPHAIHVSTPGPVGLLGVLAAKRLRVPLVGTYHTDFPAFVEHLFEDEGLARLSRRVMSSFYRRFDAVLTRSDAYHAHVAALGVDPSRIHTLESGLRTADFSPALRSADAFGRLGDIDAGKSAPTTSTPAGATNACLPPGGHPTFRLLSVGRVSVEKNMPFLARVWRAADAELQRLNIPASLHIVGDGPYREQMQRDLQGTRAAFHGFQLGLALSRLYASADLLAFPSTTDTLGQVALEAQCSGLPVLVSNQGGPQSIIRDGVTGLVLPKNNLHAWVEAIVQLAPNPQRRASMGQAARAHAEHRTTERSFEHFWNLHEQAISATR